VTALRETDRYFSPAWLLDAVLEQWGTIDLDPCHDPDPGCLVQAKTTYDIRQGQDGLVLPWSVGETGNRTKVYCNPPYSGVAPWVLRAVQHAAGGGEVLMLVNASTDTTYWQSYILRHGVCLLLAKRVSFGRPGSSKMSANLQPSAVVYFGSDVEGFSKTWAKHGTIIRRVEVAA
jgi:hypothetical protein